MDELEKFAQYFLSKVNVLAAVPFAGAVSYIEDVTSVLMFRQGQFQVQMFIVPEGTVIPEHIHPNVDSMEVYMGGNIKFSHSGKFVSLAENISAQPGSLGIAKLRGMTIRVKPNDLHGGVFGAGGGVFLSIQHWLNNIAPHCVARDYSGLSMGADHTAKVIYGEVKSPVKKLESCDAAHLEY
ncbi:MAG: hypothetical protein HOP21_09230 [Methylotenera sp.]|nr:hypothetical protein [Methylotenera sp.]